MSTPISTPMSADDVGRILRVWRIRRRVALGVAFALAIVTTGLFGWYGFWLGLALIGIVKVGFWAFPLVKLSFAAKPAKPAQPVKPAQPDQAGPS